LIAGDVPVSGESSLLTFPRRADLDPIMIAR